MLILLHNLNIFVLMQHRCSVNMDSALDPSNSYLRRFWSTNSIFDREPPRQPPQSAAEMCLVKTEPTAKHWCQIKSYILD